MKPIPRYHFRLLDAVGWNFRHAHFHEEGRRSLYKAYGIKFVIIVQGRAGGGRGAGGWLCGRQV